MEENTTIDISAVNEKIAKESAFIDLLLLEMNKVIVGQNHMVERLLIGLLGQGHILLEGVPGLAKTLAINTLSKAVKGAFSRIQFTPDLLPADVVGTMIYNMKVNDFSPRGFIDSVFMEKGVHIDALGAQNGKRVLDVDVELARRLRHVVTVVRK